MKAYIGYVRIPERMWIKNGCIYITPFMCWLCKVFKCSVIFKHHFNPHFFYSSPTAKYTFSEMQNPATWSNEPTEQERKP